jgi:hypothetical protein
MAQGHRVISGKALAGGAAGWVGDVAVAFLGMTCGLSASGKSLRSFTFKMSTNFISS